MTYHVFDFDMVDKETLVVPDGHRLVRILTGNSMNADYCFVPEGIDRDELEDELRLTFRKRHGSSSYGPFYQGYEDVSYLLDEL